MVIKRIVSVVGTDVFWKRILALVGKPRQVNIHWVHEDLLKVSLHLRWNGVTTTGYPMTNILACPE